MFPPRCPSELLARKPTQFLLLAGCQAILGRSCKARYQFFGDGNEGRGEDHCIGTCFNFQPALAWKKSAIGNFLIQASMKRLEKNLAALSDLPHYLIPSLAYMFINRCCRSLSFQYMSWLIKKHCKKSVLSPPEAFNSSAGWYVWKRQWVGARKDVCQVDWPATLAALPASSFSAPRLHICLTTIYIYIYIDI